MSNSSFSSSLSGEDAFNDHHQRQHEEDSVQLGAHLHPLHYQIEMGSVALHFGPQRWQKVQAMDEETPNKWPKKHAAVRQPESAHSFQKQPARH